MNETQTCPRCEAELPADAPAGLCPKCLLAAGMANDTGAGEASSREAPTTPLPGSGGFVAPTPAELAARFPQLEILELIGVGGMGAVYKARQPGLDRLVAVKILPPEVGAVPGFAERFTREAQALAKLAHQQIVGVFDFGQVDGLYYFIMEFVDGTNLRQLIRTCEMQPAEALAIVPQICEALQFAHDEGVVHRDIKPENILVDKRGRVKIADFGLARLLGKERPELSLTGTHQVLGTIRYMAPEQMEGSRAVDHRADIYSLGVVFYEMLTGEVPAGHFEPPSKKVAVDVRLDEVVLRALAREPERRYQQASAVKTDVEEISRSAASGRDRSFPPSTPNAAVHRRPTPFDRWAPVAISLALLAVAAAGMYAPFTGWAEIFSLSQQWHAADGVGWWQGNVVFLAFFGVLVVLIATLPLPFGRWRSDQQSGGTVHELGHLELVSLVWRRIPWFRPLSLVALSLLAIVTSASFVLQETNGILPIQPLLDAASWSIRLADGSKPQIINDYDVATRLAAGPYWAIGAALVVCLLAAAEVALHSRLVALGQSSVKQGFAPGRQHKAINAAADRHDSTDQDRDPTSMNAPQMLRTGIMSTVAVLGILLGIVMVAAALLIEPRSHGTFWGLAGGGVGTIVGSLCAFLGVRWAVRHRHATAPQRFKATPRLVGTLAGLMVLGSLMAVAGIVLLTIAVLMEHDGSGRFWGLIGAAFGCFLGGSGGLLGAWNSYRQLEGREDLMNSADWHWLDTAIALYTGAGVALFTSALAFSQTWGQATIQALLTLSAIIAIQGILFIVIRSLARRAARHEFRETGRDR